MVELTGYIIGKKIYSGSRTVVYQGIREKDQTPVVIKLLRSEYPDFNELAQFRNHYHITKDLSITGVIKSYSLEKYQNSYALVMEDFDGISLKQEMRKRKYWELEEFLSIAIQIVSALAELHQHQVIHKDINPTNILINTKTLEVKLTDFSVASFLTKENQPLSNPHILTGTLAYLSPEQTGRINRLIDYRSDFYSLGVTFFELLTGEVPFISEDPIELIYCHIAKYPPSIKTLNINIPVTISNIVNKLMAKNAEDRYQTSYGLKYDLEKCLDDWQKQRQIDNFELGEKDVSDSLIISDNPYIQEKEVITLIPTANNIGESLQLATIIKASQAIASEIKIEKLISKLMQVVMENIYAKKAAFILVKDDNLFIEATTIIGQETIIESIPIAESQEIPISLINYVSHTQETLVIDDIINQSEFAADPYIISKQPKNLLCTSIINQGKLVAILYLENSLTAGTFTKDRLDIVKLLCSQIAISLENARLYQQSQDYTKKLEKSLENFQQMQLQLVQNEKMSALGNLIAGVAHEINNPIGFIGGNIQPAVEYIWDLLDLIKLYQEKFPNPGIEIEQEIQNIELEYLREDLPQLLASMKEGVQRIRNISNSLLTFSRADTNTKTPFNIHDGINSTVLILKHRLKILQLHGAIKIVRDYGDLPLIECFPGQLNQVFMNLIANAIDALEESNNIRSETEIKQNPNQIKIQTSLSEDNNHVIIKIIDNGIGMSEQVKQKVFEHLFTTKSVGKGTGLGLSIAKQIIVEKHGGTLEVNSVLGAGTEFIIKIPK